MNIDYRIADISTAIELAIAIIKDRMYINLKDEDFRFLGYINVDKNIDKYILLIEPFKSVITIEMNKKDLTFRSEIETGITENYFYIIKQ